MKIIITLIIAGIFAFISCEKDTNPVTQTVKPGNITGILDVCETDDNSGAIVSLKGTNIVTATNYEGRWTLKDVEPGVYDIIFSKPGYDTTEVYGFPFPGNGTALCNLYTQYSWATFVYFTFYENWKIFKKSNNEIKNLTIDRKFTYDTSWVDDGHGNVWVNGIDTFLLVQGLLNYNGTFNIFLDLNPNVALDYPYYDWNYKYDISTNTFSLRIHYGFLKINLGGYGTKIYMIAYPGDYNYEIDLRTGSKRYLGLGKPSNIVEFTVPKL